MRYTNWDQLTARYPGIAKMAHVAADRVEENFIAGVESEVDARLATRYTVPFANTPSAAPEYIKSLATDLTYYRAAWMTMKETQAKALWTDIMERFEGLVDGTITIVVSGSILSSVSVPWSTHGGFPNISGTDDVEDWKVSDAESDAQEDLRDE